MAINAMATTQMSGTAAPLLLPDRRLTSNLGACGGMAWMVVEWVVRKRPTVVGIVSGSICGLVCITPGCGYVDLAGAVVIGLFGGITGFFSIQIKHMASTTRSMPSACMESAALSAA
eukprot:746796-Hanusia_phi.AAC.1